MISVIPIRYARTRAHLPVCSNLNLLLEPENYSVVSDYHSPVQQPCFSGALKVTRVEQMAQFPQSFRINESLLQRNANFQTLDCFLKQDWGREEKRKTFLSAILETGLTCLPLVLPSVTECFPFIMEALLALGCRSSGLVCGKSAQFGIRAMLQCNEVTQLPVCCTLISLLCYVGHPVSQKKSIEKVKYFADKNRNPMEWKLFWHLCHANCHQ